MRKKQSKDGRTPIHEIQYGSVKASIWANGPDHGSRYHVTFRRIHIDGEDTNEATGFRTLDLPVLAFAADEAYWWLRAREAADNGHGDSPVRRPDPEVVALFRKSARPEEVQPEHRNFKASG